jgi:hypothetical protein
VERHARRRASSGCVDEGISLLLLVDEACAVAGRVSLFRRVSGRPGAEGAPFEGRGAVTLACCLVVKLVVALGLPLGGAMRRDWGLLVWDWIVLDWGRMGVGVFEMALEG